jgi:hypothetical protein
VDNQTGRKKVSAKLDNLQTQEWFQCAVITMVQREAERHVLRPDMQEERFGFTVVEAPRVRKDTG